MDEQAGESAATPGAAALPGAANRRVRRPSWVDAASESPLAAWAVITGSLYAVLLSACVFPALPLLLGQLAVLGLWLAMGRSPLPARFLGVLAMSGFFASPALLFRFRPQEFGTLFLGMNLYVALAACMGVAFRFFGVRVVPRNSSQNEANAERQFSLRQLFLLTTVAGIAAWLLRLAPGLGDAYLWMGLLASLPFLALAVCAAWATLSDSRPVRLVTFVGVPAVGFVTILVQAEPSGWFVAIFEPVLVYAALLPFYNRGYRVRFRGDRVEGPLAGSSEIAP